MNKIVNLIVFILSPVIYIWSHIFPSTTANRISIIRDAIRSKWLSREFKHCKGIVERNIVLIGTKNIVLSSKSRICFGARIETYSEFLGDSFDPELIIGERCRIGRFSHITCINKIFIGNDTNIGDRCLISDNNHGNFTKSSYTFINDDNIPDVFLLPEMLRPLNTKGPVIIEEGCQIGEGSVILTGVTIGKHSIIASNSFVRESIPPYSIVAGNPAKIIRTFGLQN